MRRVAKEWLIAHCDDCGCEMPYLPEWSFVPDRCKACREHRAAQWYDKRCEDCGTTVRVPGVRVASASVAERDRRFTTAGLLELGRRSGGGREHVEHDDAVRHRERGAGGGFERAAVEPVVVGCCGERLLDAHVGVEELQLHAVAVVQGDDRAAVDLVGAVGVLDGSEPDGDGVCLARSSAPTTTGAATTALTGGCPMSITLLELAASALGELVDQVVSTGGATLGLWITDPAAPSPTRSTACCPSGASIAAVPGSRNPSAVADRRAAAPRPLSL